MNDTKLWWRSKTLWGAVVAMLAGAASLAGLELDVELREQLAQLALGIAEVAGGLVAAWGRAQAAQKLTWRNG